MFYWVGVLFFGCLLYARILTKCDGCGVPDKKFFFMSQQEPQRTGDVLEIMSERSGGKELRGTLSPHQEAISQGGGVGREERSQT